jgi:hypothetical protein
MSGSSVNPEEFVGEPPAGDASPGEFMSNDQSADPAEDSPDEEQA